MSDGRLAARSRPRRPDVFLGLRAAFRQFALQGGGGAIVTTGSIASLRGSAELLAYHASKHAVLGLMRCAAVYGGATATNTLRPFGGAGAWDPSAVDSR